MMRIRLNTATYPDSDFRVLLALELLCFTCVGCGCHATPDSAPRECFLEHWAENQQAPNFLDSQAHSELQGPSSISVRCVPHLFSHRYLGRVWL